MNRKQFLKIANIIIISIVALGMLGSGLLFLLGPKGY